VHRGFDLGDGLLQFVDGAVLDRLVAEGDALLARAKLSRRACNWASV
jgi:hypothetical protein